MLKIMKKIQLIALIILLFHSIAFANGDPVLMKSFGLSFLIWLLIMFVLIKKIKSKPLLMIPFIIGFGLFFYQITSPISSVHPGFYEIWGGFMTSILTLGVCIIFGKTR